MTRLRFSVCALVLFCYALAAERLRRDWAGDGLAWTQRHG